MCLPRIISECSDNDASDGSIITTQCGGQKEEISKDDSNSYRRASEKQLVINRRSSRLDKKHKGRRR